MNVVPFSFFNLSPSIRPRVNIASLVPGTLKAIFMYLLLCGVRTEEGDQGGSGSYAEMKRLPQD